MTKAYCIWCEVGDEQTKNGYLWIHTSCAEKLMDINSEIIAIREILQGIHARNKTDEDRLKLVCNFINDMEDFKRKWDNSVQNVQKYLGTENNDTEGSA